MPQPLKILMLEHSATDAELVQRLLKKEKQPFEFCLTINKKAFLQALDQFQPDVILADNSLPQFSATDALEIIQQRTDHIPFILVTGTVSEEFAAGIIKSGADDYILKDRLGRLPATIEALLLKKKSERTIKNNEEIRKLIMNSALDAIVCIETSGNITVWNSQAEKLFGWKEEEIIGKQLVETIIPVKYRQRHSQGMEHYLKTGEGPLLNKIIEINALNRADEEFPIELTIVPIKQNEREFFCAFIRDITQRKKVEEQLYRERNLLRTMIDNLPNYIYVKDTESNYIIGNQAIIELFGADSEEELTKKNALELLGPELTQINLDEDKKLITGGEPVFNRDEPITTHAGKDLWLLSTKVPLKNKDGSITGLIGISTDITARKKAEEELQAAHDRLYFHLENSPLAYIEWDINIKPKAWSKRAEEIFGWTAKEAISKQFDWLSKVYEEDLPWLRKMTEQLITGKIEKNHVQHRNYTKDGRVIWCEWFNSVLRDNDGKVITILSLVQNISERKKAEEKLRRSEMRLNEAQAIAEIGNWEIDFVQKTQTWSDEMYRIFGINKDETKPSTELFMSLMHPDDNDSPHHKVQEAFDSLKDSSFNFRFNRKDGVIRHGYSEWKFEFDKNRNPIRLYGIIQDLTELKSAEEELRQTNEELHSLSSHLQNVREEERIQIARDIHDDLGQQLTGLKMNVTWLNKKLDIKDEIVKEKMNSMVELIDETVKSVRRISSNLRPSILDDLGLIAALEWHSEEVAKRSEINVIFSTGITEPGIPIAMATGIFRIYQEVLTNAVRHANAHIITSSLRLKDDHLILKIKDDGQGMDLAISGTKKTLGLIGIKERTFVLGGKFDLTSEPGKGTEVQISIPLTNHTIKH